jgi:hypothetical protein
MSTPTYEWHDAMKELPEDILQVVIAADSNGDVYGAFYDITYDGGKWCYEGNECPVRDAVVEFWADYPKHPKYPTEA